jgi:hypothetical protein
LNSIPSTTKLSLVENQLYIASAHAEMNWISTKSLNLNSFINYRKYPSLKMGDQQGLLYDAETIKRIFHLSNVHRNSCIGIWWGFSTKHKKA